MGSEILVRRVRLSWASRPRQTHRHRGIQCHVARASSVYLARWCAMCISGPAHWSSQPGCSCGSCSSCGKRVSSSPTPVMQLTGKLLCPDAIALEGIRGSPPMTWVLEESPWVWKYSVTCDIHTNRKCACYRGWDSIFSSCPSLGYPKICKAQRFWATTTKHNLYN